MNYINILTTCLLLQVSFITGSQFLPSVEAPVAFRQFLPPSVFPYASSVATGILPAPGVLAPTLYSAPLVPNVAPAVARAVVPPPFGFTGPLLPAPAGLQARSIHAVAPAAFPAAAPAAYPGVAPAVAPVAFAR
ncbi:cyclin-dependent kinase inhibitor 1C-like [Tribolium madens]|uniref:cyclin-dependent kinase inhibitor 1C-like n=1 Tax=Tribolium madens TaxID=41895 RepID=UPI001CF75700|nr:cyclin-dependent kinase inhibitor 1C-like [Tribolium madens]